MGLLSRLLLRSLERLRRLLGRGRRLSGRSVFCWRGLGPRSLFAQLLVKSRYCLALFRSALAFAYSSDQRVNHVPCTSSSALPFWNLPCVFVASSNVTTQQIAQSQKEGKKHKEKKIKTTIYHQHPQHHHCRRHRHDNHRHHQQRPCGSLSKRFAPAPPFFSSFWELTFSRKLTATRWCRRRTCGRLMRSGALPSTRRWRESFPTFLVSRSSQ